MKPAPGNLRNICYLRLPPQHTMKGTIFSILERHCTHFFISAAQPMDTKPSYIFKLACLRSSIKSKGCYNVSYIHDHVMFKYFLIKCPMFLNSKISTSEVCKAIWTQVINHCTFHLFFLFRRHLVCSFQLLRM